MIKDQIKFYREENIFVSFPGSW